MNVAVEHELVLRSQQGDHDAFARLLDRYLRPLVRYLRLVLKDEPLAEEIAQDSFVRAFNKISTLRDPSHFRPWLFRIGRYAAIDHRRRRHRRIEQKAEPLPVDDMDIGFGVESKAELWFEYDEVLAEIRTVIDAMPEKYSQVVRLRYAEGRSISEIAEKTGLTPEQVKARAAYARRFLKAHLHDAVLLWEQIRHELF